MPKKSKTSYFTKRGNHFGNLWATYREKTEKVLLLGSDRQLAHWLLNLEFSTQVADFSSNFGTEDRRVIDNSMPFDYHFKVIPVEGPVELHFLRITGFSVNYAEKVSAAENLKCRYVEFNDTHWHADKVKILPLLRVSSFLSGGRHLYVPPGMLDAAREYVCSARSGTLREFIDAVRHYEQNLALLVFCRMYAKREICVEFNTNFFAIDTWWFLNEK